MNAASKALHQSNFFHGHLREMRLSMIHWLQLFVFMGVLFSALAVVYCTNQYRMNLSQLEHAKMESSSLQLEWGQLLLEQASLTAPSTIEQRASEKLQMSLPDNKHTRLIDLR